MAGVGFWAPHDFVLGPNGALYVLNRGGEALGQRSAYVPLTMSSTASLEATAPEMGSSSGQSPSTWTGTRTYMLQTNTFSGSPYTINKGLSWTSGVKLAAAMASRAAHQA